MKASERCIDLVKRSEGIRLSAYPDPSSGGAPWTIGYGHTRGVRRGDEVTSAQADAFLRSDILACEAAVNRANVCNTQGQFDACVDFVFNLGETAFMNSTLLRMMRAGDFAGAARQFDRWVHGSKGEVMPGLVVRRSAERAMFEGRE